MDWLNLLAVQGTLKSLFQHHSSNASIFRRSAFFTVQLLKLNIQKTKIMASSPITSWEIDGKQWKQRQTLFWGAPKSMQMVTAAMKLKDAYSLEGKL